MFGVFFGGFDFICIYFVVGVGAVGPIWLGLLLLFNMILGAFCCIIWCMLCGCEVFVFVRIVECFFIIFLVVLFLFILDRYALVHLWDLVFLCLSIIAFVYCVFEFCAFLFCLLARPVGRARFMSIVLAFFGVCLWIW